MLTQIRSETTEFLCQSIESCFPQLNMAAFSRAALSKSLEIPKKLEHGHLAFPVFSLAKELRQAPPQIAMKLAASLQNNLQNGPQDLRDKVSAILPVGGFVNFTFQDRYLQKILFSEVYGSGERLGFSDAGRGKTMVIDYVSPNVAKPLHIGHLRAAVIGQAIRNLAETQGFNVLGLNHLGDWGVQFGKLAWAYLEWGSQYDFANEPFDSLYKLYVRFHEEAAKDPEIEAKGSSTFKLLEYGDPKMTELWKKFVEISMLENNRILKLMGIQHDLVRGESFYNDRLASVEKQLQDKGLLVESEGAMVVPLGDDMPPCLIRKSDGASLYATRDLASAIYRHDELKADLSLYVVGVEQTLHFKQVFKVLELMGFDWAKNLHHISFGLYRFKEGKMSSRKGRSVFLEDVVTQAIEMVDKLIAEKNPTLQNRAKVAEQVGIGAVIFNDLAVDRMRDVEFDWEKVLSFEGDSGPYVQYTHVRCASLIKKYGKTPPQTLAIDLSSPEERELVRVLLNYQDVLAGSFANFRPAILAQYLLEVCSAFSRFYNKHRILGEAPDVEASRMGLVEVTRRILAQGLKTLNIQSPDAM